MGRNWLMVGALSATALPIAISIQAHAQSDDLTSVLSKYAKPDGSLDLQRLQADYQTQRSQAAKRASVSQPPSSLAAAAAAPKPPTRTSIPPSNAPDPTKPISDFAFAIRQNFADVGLFDPQRINSVLDSHGAIVSWTRDSVAHNTLWSVNGVATAVWGVYHDYSDTPNPKIIGISLAPYVQIDRNLNSNTKLVSKNVDTDTFGGTAEIGIDNFLGDGIHFFRDSLGVVDENIKSTRTISNVFEWLPEYSELCIHYPCKVPGVPMLFRLDPELKVQYDSTTGAHDILAFSNRSGALRIGPQFHLIAKPFGIDDGLMNRLHLNATFHWAEEAFSHRPFLWFAPSLVLNLDQSGHLALSLDYEKGHNELSGQKTDTVKISLTGKL